MNEDKASNNSSMHLHVDEEFSTDIIENSNIADTFEIKNIKNSNSVNEISDQSNSICSPEAEQLNQSTEYQLSTKINDPVLASSNISEDCVGSSGEKISTNVEEELKSDTESQQYCLTLNVDSFIKIGGASKDFNSSKISNNFTKGCKWAPDGTCILTNSEDNVLRIFNLPVSLYGKTCWKDDEEMLPELQQAVTIREGGPSVDYCWYPCMSSLEPLTCCIASCSPKCPVHLWDAFDGSLRATYNPYNDVDEIEGAYSVAFSPNGEKLYCGFKNSIRVFDITRPGRDCIKRNLKDRNLEQGERQAGIISCIAVNPVESKIYCVGSYLKTVGLYGEPDGALLCLLKAHSGGVTHIQFSPDGTKLFSGGRKDPEILCWDLRAPGQLLASLPRKVLTNQRIYFDISRDGRFLFTGNSSGEVSIYDISSCSLTDANTTAMVPPMSTWQAHQDCTNGVSVHPALPIVATSAGQRHFHFDDMASDGDSNCDNVTSAASEIEAQECGLQLWWGGSVLKNI